MDFVERNVVNAECPRKRAEASYLKFLISGEQGYCRQAAARL